MTELAQWQDMQRRVLFARIGWMRFYNGPVPGDERPIGGGRYNKDKVGHEVYNFREIGGWFYGYFQPSMASGTVNLARIDLTAADADKLSNVLVVLVARSAEGGQVMVGWYRNAEVFRNEVPRSPGKPPGYGHFCSAERRVCVLLPEYNRTHEIPSGKGALGQTNVCYALDDRGQPKDATWIQQALDFIDGYQASNILSNPEADAEDEIGEVVEKALARSKGQGFARNPKERRALEDRAMRAAKKHFETEGYTVQNVSERRPYDLLCTNPLLTKDRKELHVEVKGTTTDGGTIVLTRNEVRHACDPAYPSVLFIFHSMQLENGKALGGKSMVIDPWYLRKERLTPISFTYRVG